jgi:GT2 family glycosyltransferase
MSARLAVVLLTYNCAHRLRPILDRLVELDRPIVAVDNASHDDTRAVLAEYPAVEVVALPQNIGAAARNVGLERSGADYVAFCDDDGWYDADGLQRAVELLDRYPKLAVVNARILVGEEEALDPISAEMAQSPLPDEHGLPGTVLLGFMAGAVIVRAAAYQQAGGYDPRYFIGGEEETLAFPLVRAGWQMRYVPEVVCHHLPSIANAPYLRAYGLRNTLWTCWLHRRLPSAIRYTTLVLADHPKNRDWVRGVGMALAGAGWVARHRSPMPRELDAQLAVLDARRFRDRRPLFNRHDPLSKLRVAAPPQPPARARARARADR